MNRALILLLAVACLTGCDPAGGTPRPNPDSGARRAPAPAPDPSAMRSVGNDNHSALLHLDWDGDRAFRINFDDGHGRQEIREMRAQHGINGGWLEIPVVVDRPMNIWISGEPVSKRQLKGQAYCHIKWAGQVLVDAPGSDLADSGGVRCDAAVYP